MAFLVTFAIFLRFKVLFNVLQSFLMLFGRLKKFRVIHRLLTQTINTFECVPKHIMPSFTVHNYSIVNFILLSTGILFFNTVR
ncbi:Uncharacterised protein [Vibrio cholerae]|nr:Uncharacterised protein [Vibrio cholerae]